jgi:hypothetical protein
MLEIDEFVSDGTLIRVGTIQDGSCFFHALSYAMFPEYREFDIQKRLSFVKTLRSKIANSITLEEYLNVGKGMVSFTQFQQTLLQTNKDSEKLLIKYSSEDTTIRLAKKLLFEGIDSDEILELCFLKCKDLIRDPNEWISYEFFEWLQDIFSVNIFVIDGMRRNPYSFGDTSIYKSSRECILIYWAGRIHFEAILSSDKKGVFAFEHPLIQAFLNSFV